MPCLYWLSAGVGVMATEPGAVHPSQTPASVGLSMPAYLNGERQAILTEYSGGACKLDLGLNKPVLPKGLAGGKRGVVDDLSRDSANSMAWHACALSDKFNSMLTLTMHPGAVTNSRDFFRALNAILQARRREGRGFFWFLEFTQKGLPHVHIFLSGFPDETPVLDKNSRTFFRLASFRESERWAGLIRNAVLSSAGGGGDDLRDPGEILTANDPDFLEACRLMAICSARWEPLRVQGAAARYAAKYSAKKEQKTRPQCGIWGTSRWWGFGGVQLEVKTTHELPQADAIRASSEKTSEGFRYNRVNWYSREAYDFAEKVKRAPVVGIRDHDI